MQVPEPSPVSSDTHVTTKRPSASAGADASRCTPAGAEVTKKLVPAGPHAAVYARPRMQYPEPSPGSLDCHVTTKRPSASPVTEASCGSSTVVVLTMKSLPAAAPVAV